MTAEEKYEAFDAYLNGTLDDTTRRDLERRLKENSALREEYEIYSAARQVVTARKQWEASTQPFLQTLEDLSKEHFRVKAEAPVVSLPRRQWIIFAASIAAAILLIILVWQPWQEDLYTRYAQHPRAGLTERSTSGLLADGERAFNRKDYAAALEAFSQHHVYQPEDIEVLFYQGICYLELGREEEAKVVFRKLYHSPQPYRDTGAWYLGLTFLKLHARDSTTWYLSQINEMSTHYSTATKLLRKL